MALVEVKGRAKLERAARGLGRVRRRMLANLLVAGMKFANASIANIRLNYLTGPRPKRLGVGKGTLRSSIRFTHRTGSDDITFKFGTNVPYARVHEKGKTLHPTVTPKMRKWAWRQFFKTGDELFKGLALTRKERLSIKIKKRPFLKPGVKDKLKLLRREVQATLLKTAKEGLRGG